MNKKYTNDEFALSNDFIRLPNSLKLSTMQLLGLILSKYDWKGDESETIKVNLPLNEVRKALAENSKNYEYYTKTVIVLQSRARVTITEGNYRMKNILDLSESTKFASFMLFPYINYENGEFIFQINPFLNKYFQLLKQNYTVIKIANTVKFTSRFSYILYLNLCSWNDHRIEREDPLDERTRYYTTRQLKDMFNISDDEYILKQKTGNKKFNRGQFEKRVIEKAIDEINKYTDIQVTWHKEKNGNTVSKYVFEWFRKKDFQDETTGLNKL